MGPDFESIVKFFESVEQQLIPLVLQATSDVITSPTNEDTDLWSIHHEGNNNFRLIDYHRTSDSSRQGAREHRDPSTATIIFQDGSGGLEVQDPYSGVWRAVPGNETVIMWGLSGQLFSGGRVKAVNHRVRSIPSFRRNSAVFFISPDHEARLRPLVPGRFGNGEINPDGELTVGRFVEMMRNRRSRMQHRRN